MKKRVPSRRRARRLLRLLRRTVLVLLLTAALLLAGLFFFLQTGRGGDWLSTLLTRPLGATGQSLQVRGLRLRLPTHARLETASLSGSDGKPWLSLERLELTWNPAALLLERSWSFPALDAEAVRLLERPAFSTKASPTDKKKFRPLFLPPVQVQHLRVEELYLDEAVAGRTLRGTLSGHGEASGSEAALALNLEGILPASLHATGRFNVERREAAFALDTALLTLGTNRVEQIRGEGTASLNPLRGTLDSSARINGLDAALSTSWTISGGAVRLEDALLRAGSSELKGKTGYNWKKRELDAEARLRVPDLAFWSGWAGVDGYKGGVEGTLSLLPEEGRSALVFQVDTRGLETPYAAVERGTWAGRIAHLLNPLAAALELEVALEEIRRDRVRLDRADLHLAAQPGAPETFPVTFKARTSGLDAEPVSLGSLELEGRHENLKAWKTSALQMAGSSSTARVAGVRAQGLEFQLELLPEAAWSNLSARAEMKLLGADLYGVEVEALHGRVDGQGLLDPHEAAGTLQVGATNLQYGSVRLARADGSLSSLSNGWSVALSTQGDQPFPLDFETGLQVALGDEWAVEIGTLKGSFDEQSLLLVEPVRFTAGKEAFRLESCRIRLADAALTASAELVSNRVQAAILLDELPVHSIPYLPTSVVGRVAGVFSGSAELSGTLSEPEFQASLRVGKLRPLLPKWPENATFTADGAAAWKGTNLSASVTFASEEFASGKVLASREAALSLVPFRLSWPTNGYTRASVTAGMDLGPLGYLPAFSSGRIEGNMQADVEVSGPASARKMQGAVRLTDASLDYYPAGLMVRDLNLEVEGREGALNLVRAEATDGGKGRLRATGRIAPSAGGGYEYRAQLEVNRAALVRMDLLETVLSGSLEVEGRPKAHQFRGALNLEEGRLHLDALPPPAPPRVRPIPDPEAEQVAEGNGPGARSTLQGAITLDIPNTLVARGEGLDSTWGGYCKLEAGPKGLALSGEIQPRRGTFQFLSRRFTLEEGRIWFSGAWPPLPFIDLTAVVDRRAITAQLRVQGRADQLSFSLESIPQMPEDEILAQILFGRDVASITGLQALQLAAAARTLTRGTSGPGFLDRARDRMGIDVVEIQETGEGDQSEPSLVLGKQINERLYLQVDRSMNKPDGAVTAEYEISPSFNVGVRVGSSLNQGIGFNWKKNY